MRKTKGPRTSGHKVTDEDRAAIRRMFLAIDVIDAAIAGRPLPTVGEVPCPNCPGSIRFSQRTALKGAARCSTDGCVEFQNYF